MDYQRMRFSTVSAILLRSWESQLRSLFKLTPRPYKVLLELTESCNSRCGTCHIWKTQEGVAKVELALPTVEAFLKNFGSNLLWISFSGGEPTLYREFPALIELIRQYCPNLKLAAFTSNGLIPSRVALFAKELKRLNCDFFVTLSLDGPKEVHDQVRGVNGNYDLAMKSFKALQDDGINPYWGITLSDQNQHYVLDEKSDLTHFKAVTFAHSDGIYKTKNSVNHQGLSLMLEKMSKQFRIGSPSEFFEWVYIRLSRKFVGNGLQAPVPCEVIATNLHVKANGDVHPCMFVEKLGNLAQRNLSDILKDPGVSQKMRDYRKGQCPQCWMNCYAPHSMLAHPLRSAIAAFGGSK